ncbi:MAG: OmpA family protein [Verrucomicrobia bacterium]|nr:OmpA family protein [Verrucomicrobiota bacterium]
MKTANPLTRLVLSLILSFGLVGCKKVPKGPTPIPLANRTVTEPVTPQGPAGDNVPQANQFPNDTDPNRFNLATDPEDGSQLGSREIEGNYIVDRETFAAQTVYFELDSSTINPGEKAKIDTIAAYLKNEPTFRLRVEGHCDERGTDEYNRALGERRALSILDYLKAFGVTSDRLTTLSYGEDKPAMFGSDEASWAKNRRGESVLLRPRN